LTYLPSTDPIGQMNGDLPLPLLHPLPGPTGGGVRVGRKSEFIRGVSRKLAESGRRSVRRFNVEAAAEGISAVLAECR